MNFAKRWYQSRTIYGALVALVPSAVLLVMHYTGDLALGTEALMGAWSALAGGVLAVVFRVRASQPISGHASREGSAQLRILVLISAVAIVGMLAAAFVGCTTSYTCLRTDPAPELRRTAAGGAMLTIPCQGDPEALLVHWPDGVRLRVEPALMPEPAPEPEETPDAVD
ncbi:MAG: hypothetical protein ABIH03_17400 [Pseudomonadota bacterium]